MQESVPDHLRKAIVTTDAPKEEVSFSQRLKGRIYAFIKESAIAEEIKKEGVDVKEFEKVKTPLLNRNSTLFMKAKSSSKRTLKTTSKESTLKLMNLQGKLW